MNKIPLTKVRQDFLNTASKDKIAQYFKKLEKLSKTNRVYGLIYNMDHSYYFGPQTGGFLTNKKKKDTKIVCSDNPEKCNEINEELNSIQSIISKDKLDKKTIEAINKLLDFGLCCPNNYYGKLPKSVYRVQLANIVKLILKSEDLFKYTIRVVNKYYLDNPHIFNTDFYNKYKEAVESKNKTKIDILYKYVTKYQRDNPKTNNILTTAFIIALFKEYKNRLKCKRM